MQKLVFSLFLLLQVFLVSAQSTLTVSGNVTKVSDGSPVADWYVYAYTAGDPADTTTYAYGYGFTDAVGHYSFNMDFPAGTSFVVVQTFTACDTNTQSLAEQTVPIMNGAASADFQICANQPPAPDCFVWIDYLCDPNNGVQFGSYYSAIDSNAFATSYLWDFGDGTTSTEANPYHQYAQEGEYIVTLTVTGSGGCTATSTQYVYVGNTNPIDSCQAYVTYDQVDSLTFQFTAFYYGPGSTSTAAAYFWDFGDGTISTDASPVHTYTQPGFYIGTLIVTGADGCSAYYIFAIFTDAPPSPDCYAYITYGQLDTTTFQFGAELYSAWGPSAIVSYSWDFGDGTTSTEINPIHTYPTQGIYNVLLEVETADSCVAHACEVVFALDCPVDTFWYGCQAMFYTGFNQDSTWTDPNGGPVSDPLTVNFYDASFGNVSAWAWDFGDGSSSTEQNPVHTYAQEGFYTVTLTIQTLDGCESSAAFEIYVGENYPWNPEFDCQAMFLPMPDSLGGNGLQFFDLSITQTPVQSWAWDFGDGTTSTEQNPFHVYSVPGVYTVSLTITADSCNSVISFAIDTQNPWNFVSNGSPTQLGLAAGSSSTKEKALFETLNVFPNPVQDELSLLFSSKSTLDYEMRISDLSGRTMITQQERSNNGQNLLRVNAAALTPGMYLVQLRSADQIQTIKFVKQ